MAHIIKSYESTGLSENITPTVVVNNDDISNYSIENNDAFNNISDENDPVKDDIKRLNDEKYELMRKLNDLECKLKSINEEYDAKLDEALEKNIQLGIEQGREEYLASIQDNLDNLDALIETIGKEYKVSLCNSMDDIVDIVFTSVTKIIAKKYSRDDIRMIVDDCIENVCAADMIKIHVSIDDFPYFKNYSFSNKSLMLRSNSRVQYGGCILESNNERLDCRLDKKLEIFKKMLMEAHSDDSRS